MIATDFGDSCPESPSTDPAHRPKDLAPPSPITPSDGPKWNAAEPSRSLLEDIERVGRVGIEPTTGGL